MVYKIDLKEVETKKIKGEEKIENPNTDTRHPYLNAKHTYLKCNACGKKFSLNYSDKTFEEAKQIALKKKWEHAEEEHHHQSEILYLGEEEVQE